ncbi:MAG: hypothetical protein ACM3TT_02445 [Syntrophothermus sp.]
MNAFSTCPDEPVLQEALRLIREAEAKGILLRLLGSTAVRVHCYRHAELFEALGRPMADLDFITNRTWVRQMPEFMESQGYEADREVLALFGAERQIYDHPATGLHVDLFFDRLSFCHEIDLRGRLELDSPTITLADIFLEKLQIVKITGNDLKDLAILVAEHGIGPDDPETIDAGRISRVLAQDWGFYHTSMSNLDTLAQFVTESTGVKAGVRERILTRIQEIRDRADAEPKSLQWKLRAKIGPRVKWYTDVDEIRR